MNHAPLALVGCSLHTVTTRPWALPTCIQACRTAGVGAITLWREAIVPYGAASAGRMIREAGLEIAGLCRSGFFPASSASRRQDAIDQCREAIDEAALATAPVLILVCGAEPGQPLTTSREQIAEGIRAIEPHARAAGVRLAIEPLHPMYAADRSAISTLGQARVLLDGIGSDIVGLAIDTYHCWWDDALPEEIRRAGVAGRIFAFHVSDWRIPTRDLLEDRAVMGTGCIDIPDIRRMVVAAGFSGHHEIEILSAEGWQRDQQEWFDEIIRAYQDHC